MKIELVPVDGVRIGERHRPLVSERVAELAESIRCIGLLQPITVYTPDDATVDLVAGRHRLAAAQKLGWEDIQAIFVTGDEIDRELIEIAENLHRCDLTKEQRDQQIRRYAELLESRAKVQSAQNAPIESKRADGRGHRAQGVASKIATATGLSKDTVKRALKPKSPPAKPKEKPVEHPADQMVAAVRSLNIKLEPKAIEIATSVLTEEQRADLQHHLPDVIGKLQRLVAPVADAPDLTATEVEVADEGEDQEGEGDDPFAGLPRPKWTSRPKRWAEACQQAMAALEELQELQQQYQDWRQNLPENMEASATAEKLDAIESLDIEGAMSIVQEIEDADLPLGFGRD